MYIHLSIYVLCVYIYTDINIDTLVYRHIADFNESWEYGFMLVCLLSFVSGSEDGHIPTFWLLL